MLKERPYELNQKLRRVQTSRDNIKASNREKTLENKTLRDRNKEIIQSRDMWKSRTQELAKALKDQEENLTLQLMSAREALDAERIRAERERERADLLQVEVEQVKKKLKI